jgi:uncharacterized protein YjbI with pentapeptide repeats/cytoskeletal protein CcmA (bactofilin family)
MTEFAAEEITSRVKRGEKIERADLRGVQLPNAELDGASLRRCDLDGANLEGAQLKRANLKNVSLREAMLAGADLRDANFDNADLEGANLERANLAGANLNRANLQRAKLAGANLTGAKLRYSQLDSASLTAANLTGAALSYAELVGCDLVGAELRKADLTSSNLRSANIDRADLTEAVLKHIQLAQATGRGAKLVKASLLKANLSDANLTEADLTEADAREANVTRASLAGATLTGAKIAGLITKGTTVDRLAAAWVDTSASGDSSRRVHGEKIRALLQQDGSVQPAAGEAAPRYFGRGDILRNASLQIEEGAFVEIESVFEQCSISLGRGAELVVGKSGVLSGCQIAGEGRITVHGHFFERESPGIAGVTQLVVSAGGALVGAVRQPAEGTTFGFEPGCRLRMKILEVPEAAVARAASAGSETGSSPEAGTTKPKANTHLSALAPTGRETLPEMATLVEDGTHLQGALATSGPLVVKGKLEGSVSAPSLTVTQEGSVRGKVRVGRMASEGELAGEFDADVFIVSGAIRGHSVVRAKTIDVKLPSSDPEAAPLVFGECVLDIGDAPSREAALTASLSTAARDRAAKKMAGPAPA